MVTKCDKAVAAVISTKSNLNMVGKSLFRSYQSLTKFLMYFGQIGI